MKILILTLFSYLSPLYAEAQSSWQEKGNGGDVIVCENSKDNKMYDTYETVVRHQLKLKIPGTDGYVESASYTGFEDLRATIEVAKVILDRLQSQDPELQSALIKILYTLQTEVRFVANSELVNIEDFGMGFIPRNCELKQLIIQRSPQFHSDRKYTIALDYWKTLSNHNKVAGLLHEVLYNYALSLNPTLQTSEPIRYFNALLLSDSMNDISRFKYQTIKKQVFMWSSPNSSHIFFAPE